jgi:NodT family efflux transporter outer membrane factor (OMF) lipoprotein
MCAMALLAVVLLDGCSVHHVERAPDVDINATHSFSMATDLPAPQNSTPWYREFEDPQLESLIEQALRQNFELKASRSRFLQARALARISDVAALPSVDVEAGANYRFEENRERTTYDIGVALSWEIDLFGRLENAALFDAMETQARQEDLEALRFLVAAEVARNYFGALSAYRALDLLQEQVRLDTHYLELIMLRFENGVGTTVEVLQQKGQLAQSQSLIPIIKASLRKFENRLDLLLGQVPDGINRLDSMTPECNLSTPRHTGIPSQLLLRRPDLRAQRHRLVAADAAIGEAIAQRLPSLTLGASLFRTENLNYAGPLGMLGASLIQPLLDWGAREAQVHANRALYQEQLSRYGESYLKAIEEVENALYAEQQQREYLERLEARRAILQLTVDEAKARYMQGISDYLPVLNALEALHQTERLQIDARYALLEYRITLYRALGSDVSIEDQNKESTP